MKGLDIMNRYKEARLHAGLSQKAAAISLGIKPPSMSDWESGKTKPTHEHLVGMADLYGVSLAWLLGAEEEQKEKPTAVSDDGLMENIITRVQDLPVQYLSRLSDFLDGMEAARSTALAEAAAPGPVSGSAPSAQPAAPPDPAANTAPDSPHS